MLPSAIYTGDLLKEWIRPTQPGPADPDAVRPLRNLPKEEPQDAELVELSS